MFSFSKMSSALTYTLELSERSIQEQVALMMPLEKKQFYITLRLSEPKVQLINASNEIAFSVQLEVIAPGGLSLCGRGQINGSVRYEQSSGEFFLNKPKLVKLEIDLLSKIFNVTITKLTELVLTKACERRSVYRLRDDDASHQFAKSTLKSIRVKDHKLKITLGMF